MSVLTAVLLSSSACKDQPSELAYPKTVFPIDTIALDTAETTTIDLSSPDDEIVITINSDGLDISAPNYTSYYSNEVIEIYLVKESNGDVKLLKADGKILYSNPHNTNHGYKYLNNGTIEVSQGNTLLGIIADHKREGYNISLASVLKCNQYIVNREKYKLFPGDIICLECK